MKRLYVCGIDKATVPSGWIPVVETRERGLMGLSISGFVGSAFLLANMLENEK